MLWVLSFACYYAIAFSIISMLLRHLLFSFSSQLRRLKALAPALFLATFLDAAHCDRRVYRVYRRMAFAAIRADRCYDACKHEYTCKRHESSCARMPALGGADVLLAMLHLCADFRHAQRRQRHQQRSRQTKASPHRVRPPHAHASDDCVGCMDVFSVLMDVFSVLMDGRDVHTCVDGLFSLCCARL